MALKRNIIANYLGQGWVALMGLAFIPLYIKYLGIESYGLIGLFAVLHAWLGLLDMGLTPMLGREMARYTGGGHSNELIRDLLHSVELMAYGIALLIAGSVLLSSDWIAISWLRADTLPVDVVAKAFSLMGVVTALRYIEGIYRSVLIGLQRQVLFNSLNSAIATVRWGGAAAILNWFPPSIEAFFIWQGFVSLVSVVILAVITHKSLSKKGVRSGRFSIEALRKVWRFAAGMFGITLLALLLTQVDKLILSGLLSLSEFGYYSLAGTVATTVYLLTGPITQAFYPKYCELLAKNDLTSLTECYHTGAQLVSTIAGSAAIVLIVFAEMFLFLWTHDATLAIHVAPLLQLLLLGTLLNGLMWIPYQMQLAHGWTSLALRVNAVAVAIVVPAILWAVPRYGAEGAAWVWIILNAGYLLIAVQYMHQKILTGEKQTWYLKDIALPILGGFIGATLVKLFCENPSSDLAQIIIIGLAIVLTLTLSMSFSDRLRRKVIALIIRLSLRYSASKS